MPKNTDAQTPFKTIIVGADFSGYSRLVVRQAQRLADQFNAQMVLVHAALITWDPTGSGINVPQIDLSEVKTSLKKFYGLKNSDTIVEARRGDPTGVILSVAKKYKLALIIVGSQGKGAISRFILGSQAESLALKSPFPVWVHRGRKIVPLKKILIPTDLSGSSKTLIDQIKNWSRMSSLKLKYIFVKPLPPPLLNYKAYKQIHRELSERLEDSLKLFKKSEGPIKITTISAPDPAVKISQLGKQFDVIAMTPHERSGVFRKFGPVTAKVIRLSETPVLVFKS